MNNTENDHASSGFMKMVTQISPPVIDLSLSLRSDHDLKI